jgi:hypothetical protein
MHCQKQSGESLIEFMLLLSLSLFIIAGAFKLVIMAKAELRYQFAQNDLSQNLLISEYALREAVESSGIASCGQIGSLLSFKNLAKDQAGRVKLSQEAAVEAFDISQVEGLNLDRPGSGQAIDNTDVLLVRKLSEQARLAQAVFKNTQNLTLPEGFRVKLGQVLLISDCQYLVSDRVIELEGNNAQLEYPLGLDFKKGSMIGKFDFEAYYIGKTLRKNLDGKPITALYMQDSQAVRHELVPDVVRLKLQAFSHAVKADIKVQSEQSNLSEENGVLLVWQ